VGASRVKKSRGGYDLIRATRWGASGGATLVPGPCRNSFASIALGLRHTGGSIPYDFARFRIGPKNVGRCFAVHWQAFPLASFANEKPRPSFIPGRGSRVTLSARV